MSSSDDCVVDAPRNDSGPASGGAPQFRSVCDASLTWGESLRWDDRRQRLYFVDTAADALFWIDEGDSTCRTISLPSKPTGVVLTNEDRLVICLDDGLYIVDPDTSQTELLAPYPSGMHGRANDANADHLGNLVTGTLNLAPGPGALWQFSSSGGWTQLIESFGNTNGPNVLERDGDPVLVVADTLAQTVFAFPYDGRNVSLGEAELLAGPAEIGGFPDGASGDSEGGVWSCVVGAGKVLRLFDGAVDRILDVPMMNPSDVAFGGPAMDRLYITSIALDLGAGVGEGAGTVVAADVGITGRPDHRFTLP